ncbi:ACP S-malonyltransferase [Chitinophaga rhizosphaerae]|uniref:ACP S-malonyltransferase n=1 Tax=Chitinophaga rhizosphaerae TaxID=1864947 RepID=UPI000F7FC704|nr:ACP S-malonyltransferase [Chitinophaga rhizosphaerae]
MKHAFVFPGQGAQFTGMGKAFYEQSPKARDLFEQANELLGFRISDVMFEGSEADLKQTKVTQPAVFLHSVIGFLCLENARPDMTAGHSLGEFSALVANGALGFADALKLVSIRANAMQKACEITPSTMAVVLGLDDAKVEEICATITDDTVVPANYNCPGQLVISGTKTGIAKAMELLKAAGAKRVMELAVGGAFHSPLMAPAQAELQAAIESIAFNSPNCPVYQNVAAKAVTNPAEIKQNLITQLTGAVKWTQCVQAMVADGGARFTEVGPGKVLQGLIAKIDKNVATDGVSDTLVLA